MLDKIKIFTFFTTIAATVSGYLYNYFYYRGFGLNPSDYFQFNDYLSTIIGFIAFNIVVSIIIYFYVQRKLEDISIGSASKDEATNRVIDFLKKNDPSKGDEFIIGIFILVIMAAYISSYIEYRIKGYYSLPKWYFLLELAFIAFICIFLDRIWKFFIPPTVEANLSKIKIVGYYDLVQLCRIYIMLNLIIIIMAICSAKIKRENCALTQTMNVITIEQKGDLGCCIIGQSSNYIFALKDDDLLVISKKDVIFYKKAILGSRYE